MPKYINTAQGTLCLPELERGWFNNFGVNRAISSDVPVTDAACNILPAAVLGPEIGAYYVIFEIDTSQISPSIVTPVKERFCIIRDTAESWGVYGCPLGEEPDYPNNTIGTNIHNQVFQYRDDSGRPQPARIFFASLDNGDTIDGTKVSQLVMWPDPALLEEGTWEWEKRPIAYNWIYRAQGIYPTYGNTIPWDEVNSVFGGPMVDNINFSIKAAEEFFVPLNAWTEGLVGVAEGGVPYDFYGEFSTSEEGTAYAYDWGNVSIGSPELPSDGALSCGLLTLYHPSDATLTTLAGYLTSDNFFDNLLKSWSDPMQSIISLYLLPVSPSASRPGNLIFGGIDTEITTNVVTERYIRLRFGQVDIDERMRGFLDYGSNAKLSIHLPYAGFHDLPSDMWMASSIGLDLSLDLLTGSGLYNLTCVRDNQLLRHSIPVNMASPVPLTSNNYMGAFNALINAASSAAQGNFAGALQAATGKMVDTKVSGSAGTVPGSMGQMRAWITLEETDYALPAQYSEMMGWPLEVSRQIGSLSGFISATVNTQEMSYLTDYERAEIERLLEKGVII